MITADRNGRVEYMNLVAEVLTGWRADEARGKQLPEIFKVVNGIKEGYRVPAPVSALAPLDNLSHDTVLIARDGNEYAIEDSTAPIRDRSHAIVGTVVVFHDVTRSRDLARQIAQQASQEIHGAVPSQRYPSQKKPTHA